jgi:hypothetical protein
MTALRVPGVHNAHQVPESLPDRNPFEETAANALTEEPPLLAADKADSASQKGASHPRR